MSDARFNQVVVLLVEGLGVGAPSTGKEQGAGRAAHSLGHVATYVGGLELPFLQWLGLGNLATARGLHPADPPAASTAVVEPARGAADPKKAVTKLFGKTLSALVESGVHVAGIGPVAAHLDDEHVSTRVEAASADVAFDHVLKAVRGGRSGVVVASLGGAAEAGGPVGVARDLVALDAALPRLLDCLDATALLLIVGLTGSDATIAARRPMASRELTPVLAYSPAIPSGVDLGRRKGLSDVGATIADNFGAKGPRGSKSFFGPLVS